MATELRAPLDDPLTEIIIGRAIEVHRHLGPGLLESTYEECLSWEFREAELAFTRQVHVPVIYKGQALPGVYRLDFVVEQRVVIEVKAADRIASVHEAQLRTYMRHTGIPIGLLFNFNSAVLIQGLRRLSLPPEALLAVKDP